MDDSLRDARRDFGKGELLETNIPKDPFDLMVAWQKAAADHGIADFNAMSLSTIDADGFPVSRIVLLREITDAGLCFFTNYLSAKGRELGLNPKAGLQFFWPSLERQIRLRGMIEKLTEAESDAYFATRPRDSQIGAWASPQSETIGSRQVLEDNFRRYVEKFAGNSAVPRPSHWGGYRLVPDVVEFWQGRPSRLHDRLRARLIGNCWQWVRLAP